MTRRNVHLFVFDSMADWEASFAIAGINNPQFQRESGPVSCSYSGTHHEARHDDGRSAHSARHLPL